MNRRRRVNVGRDFEGEVKLVEAKTEDAVKRTEAKVKARTEDVRSWLVIAMLAVGSGFLLGAAVLGVYKGSFVELQGLWNVQGPMLGVIVAYYFGTNDKDGGGSRKA